MARSAEPAALVSALSAMSWFLDERACLARLVTSSRLSMASETWARVLVSARNFLTAVAVVVI